MRQRHDAPVDLGAAAAMAEGGMHAVGKVQRRRAVRQVDHLALGGEHVDPVLEQLRAHALDQVAVGIRAAAAGGLEQPPHPLDLALVLARRAGRLPCRSSAPRHRARRARASRGCGSAPRRSWPAGRSPRCGSSGSRCPWGSRRSRRTPPGCRATAVHDAERRVALGDRAHHDAYRAHVEQLLEGELLALHLAVDAVDVLGPPVHLRLDARAVAARARSSSHNSSM